MSQDQIILNNLIDRLKNRLYRAFNEFEVNDENCYKHFWETRNGLEAHSYEFKELNKSLTYYVILSNLDILIDTSIGMDGDFSMIRGLTFDTLHLLDELKG